MRIGYLILVVAALVVGLPGCTKPAGDADGSSGAATGAARPTTPDDKIASAVKEKFAADSELKGEKIDVTVKDGRVTLTGTVSSDLKRIRAEDTAREVDDVFGVDAEKLVIK